MATTASMPEPEPQVSMSTVGRLTGALFSPKATFTDIAARPNWLGPMVLLTVLSIGVSALLAQKMDWRNFFEQQNAKNSRMEQMPPDQKEKVLESQLKYAPAFTYGIGLLGPLLGTLVIALVYWGAFNLFTGAGLKYDAAFGITAHAFVPSALASVLAIVTVLLKPRGDIDPEHLLASSVGAFLPESAPRWLTSLSTSLEFFWIWCMVLLAVGFSAANPKKIEPGTAFRTVFGLWLLWAVVKAGWAAL